MRHPHHALTLARLVLRLTVLLAVLLVTGGVAEARHVRFAGPHPVHGRYGGGYCYLEVPHLHAYAPDHVALYTESPDGYLFIGDPSPFGYQGERHAFYGHHPVPLVGAPRPVFCYIDGPHYHPFAAPESPEYVQEGDATFFVGSFGPVYYQERPRRVRVVQAEYRPYVALRPVVEVRPPPAWHGEIWVPPPPVVSIGVPAPAPPRIVVGVPAPPPPPRIVVGAPPPPRVVVGAPLPPRGPVVMGVPVGRGRGEGWHHDNGLHRGWDKGRHRGH